MRVERTVLVEHTAEQMCGLVDRIEDYPLFLPWCSSSALISRTETETVGKLHLEYHGIKQHFTTRNDIVPGRRITLNLIEGPFKSLAGSWAFTPLGEHACKVSLNLEYQFSNIVLEKLIGPVFNRIMMQLIDAFVTRADVIYPHD